MTICPITAANNILKALDLSPWQPLQSRAGKEALSLCPQVCSTVHGYHLSFLDCSALGGTQKPAPGKLPWGFWIPAATLKPSLKLCRVKSSLDVRVKDKAIKVNDPPRHRSRRGPGQHHFQGKPLCGADCGLLVPPVALQCLSDLSSWLLLPRLALH